MSDAISSNEQVDSRPRPADNKSRIEHLRELAHWAGVEWFAHSMHDTAEVAIIRAADLKEQVRKLESHIVDVYNAQEAKQVETNGDPVDPTNHHFRLCLKGHVSYSISFAECPSCKVERERTAETSARFVSQDRFENDDGSRDETTVPLDYKLPCEVRLPPAMSIGKGCPLSTLMHALRHREQWSDPQDLVFQDERAMAMRRALNALTQPENTRTISTDTEYCTIVESPEKASVPTTSASTGETPPAPTSPVECPKCGAADSAECPCSPEEQWEAGNA